MKKWSVGEGKYACIKKKKDAAKLEINGATEAEVK